MLVGLVGDVGQEVGHELQGLLGGGWAVGLLVRIIETDDQEKPVRDPEPVGRVLGAVVPGVELAFQVRDVEAFDIAARVRRQGVPVPFYAIARVKFSNGQILITNIRRSESSSAPFSVRIPHRSRPDPQ